MATPNITPYYVPAINTPTPYSQKKIIPPSRIPQRGWKPPRQKKDLKTPDGLINSPIINEVLSYEPHVVVSDNQKYQIEKAQTNYILEQEHEARKFFLKTVLCPPRSLEMPEVPQVEQILSFSVHHDDIPKNITGPIFSIKELDTIPSITVDDDAVLMRQIRDNR